MTDNSIEIVASGNNHGEFITLEALRSEIDVLSAIEGDPTEAAHLASVLADHVAKAVTEARARELREAVEAVLSDLWIPSPVAPESIAQNELLHEIRAVLLARADSLAPEAPSEDWEPSPEDVADHHREGQ